MEERFDAIVRAVFPEATRGNMGELKGWLWTRPPGAPKPAREGTMPSDRIFLGVAMRKAGPTFYFWYPGAAGVPPATRHALEQAGYKVMVGCLAWTRKTEPPMEPLAALFRSARERDERPSRPA